MITFKKSFKLNKGNYSVLSLEFEMISKDGLKLKSAKKEDANKNRTLSINDQLNRSLEDIDTIIEVQKALIQHIPNCDENKLLRNLKEQWTAYQYSSISSQSLLAINSK